MNSNLFFKGVHLWSLLRGIAHEIGRINRTVSKCTVQGELIFYIESTEITKKTNVVSKLLC